MFKLKRFMTSKEMWRLQGVPDNRVRRPEDITVRQWCMMIGNGFSVNVMCRLLARILPAAGLSGPLASPWE